MQTHYQRSLPHRGAAGDMKKFALRFLEARLQGFAKDMRLGTDYRL
jgi:hypothetical protein